VTTAKWEGMDMGTKSRTAIAALVVGIACFLNLLGIEKAIAAIVIGWLGLKDVEEDQKAGKKLAYAGIILGCAYIVTVTVMLILYGPQFIEHIKMLKG
jgi:hypothetical protein